MTDQKTACAFHQYDIGQRRKLAIGSLDNAHIDLDLLVLRGDVRGDGFAKAIRIHPLQRKVPASEFGQQGHVFIDVHAVDRYRAGGNGFHRRDGEAALLQREHQCTGDKGLADIGVGAGDEKARHDL